MSETKLEKGGAIRLPGTVQPATLRFANQLVTLISILRRHYSHPLQCQVLLIEGGKSPAKLECNTKGIKGKKQENLAISTQSKNKKSMI